MIKNAYLIGFNYMKIFLMLLGQWLEKEVNDDLSHILIF